MTLLAFLSLLNFISSATLAGLVFWKCPRRDWKIGYGVTNLFIALFSANYCWWQMSPDASSALLPMKMLTASALWINQSLLYFVFSFTGLLPRRRAMLWVAAIFNCVLTVMVFTGSLFASLEPRAGLGYWPIIRPMFPVYLAFWHAELILAFGVLWRCYRSLSGAPRNRLRYLVLALGIGYCGGITNWPLWFNINVPPYANGLITVYVSLVAYAIVKHQLMDVTVIIRKTLVYSVATGGLTAIYFAILFALAQGVEGVVKPGPFSSFMAACAIALLFNPMRVKIQSWADRKFPREALDQQLLREATSGFVHEIKRPLINISVPAQLALQDLQSLQEGTRPSEIVLPVVIKRLHYIIDESASAGEMVEAIRSALFPERVAQEAVDLKSLFDELLEREASRLAVHGIEVTLTNGKEWLLVKGNVRQFEVAFHNVIKNAMEAISEGGADGGTIVITAEPHPPTLRVAIADSGPGIAPSDLTKIFDPYFSTRGRRGTGIGLYLAREVLRVHGGTLTAENGKTRGAIFVATIPLWRES